MAEITAAAVKALRDKTDLPMMLCKQALVEAGGDEAQAIEILKRDVEKVRVKRAENVTAEGRIFSAVKDDGSRAAMVEVQCESAPVAGGQDLGNFGGVLTQQLLEGPGASTPDDLLSQPAPDGSGRMLADIFDELINKIREKIVVTRLARAEGPVGVYIHHDGKVGVLFQAEGENKTAPVLRDVAMHIAAMKSTVVNPDELDPAKVQEERQRLAEQARATGKPDNIVEKIVEGRLKTFYVEEGVLNVQPFVKEEAKTVSQALAEHGLKAKRFERWVIGAAT